MESETKVYKMASKSPILGAILFTFALIYIAKLPIYVAAAVVLIMICPLRPPRLELGSENLKIVRGLLPSIVIPLSTITSVERFELIGRPVHIGYIWFRNGGITTTITDNQRAVLITANKKYAVSPENPDIFIEDLKQRAGLSA
ncbi:MAG: PH domain-containing protein [Armatimonadota bacterium]